MITVGAFEAKTHLYSLLDRVAGGEEVLITRHGKPLARLVGAKSVGAAERDQADVDVAVEQLQQRRTGTTLDGLSSKELRDAGRR